MNQEKEDAATRAARRAYKAAAITGLLARLPYGSAKIDSVTLMHSAAAIANAAMKEDAVSDRG